MVKVKKLNASYIKVFGDPKEREIIAKYFTHFAPNYKFSPLYKRGRWDGTIKFYHPSTSQIPCGLLVELLKCCKLNKLEYELEDNILGTLKSIGNVDMQLATKGLNKKYKPRDFQIEGVEQSIMNSRGLLEYATGAGKTLTLFLIINYIINTNPNAKIAVVVINKGLLLQFYNDFLDYGLSEKSLGKYYGKEKDGSKQVTIGTWQSLHKDKDLLLDVSHLIADECHSQKATVVKTLTQSCVNAFFRIGCTGTLPKNTCEILTIEGSFGKLLNKVKSAELIKRKILSQVEIIQIKHEYSEELSNACKGSYQTEKKVVLAHKPRMKLVMKIIKKHKKNENMLLLFDELEFGRNMYKSIKVKFPKKNVKYVAGDTELEVREAVRANADIDDDTIIVASVGVFAAGINIKKLHSLVFLWVGKSEIRILQSIGRILRTHATKSKAVVYDIVDGLAYHLHHASQRRDIYDREGFPYKIIHSADL